MRKWRSEIDETQGTYGGLVEESYHGMGTRHPWPVRSRMRMEYIGRRRKVRRIQAMWMLKNGKRRLKMEVRAKTRSTVKEVQGDEDAQEKDGDGDERDDTGSVEPRVGIANTIRGERC